MPYALFHSRFPEVAERETRSISVFANSDVGLPAGNYGFLEMFCDEPGCDCRRVFFYVVSSLRKDVEAVIAWGWESRAFYARWMKENDPLVLDALKGPALNLSSSQTRLALALLNVVADVLLQDSAYVERVKTHYRMFREHVEKGAVRKVQACPRPSDSVRPCTRCPRSNVM
jgi:hypothetical protein